MRTILLASAGLIIALSTAGVANANNPNVPSWSPYSLNTNAWRPQRHPMRRMAQLREGRAAATKAQAPIFSDGSSDENYMVPDSSAAPATGAPEAPGGQHPADR